MAFSLQQTPSQSIASAATSSALTVTKPSLGQLLVAGVGLASSTVGIPSLSITDNGSAGWTAFHPTTGNGYNFIHNSIIGWFYKQAASADTSGSGLTQITFSWTNGSGQTGGTCFMDEYHGFIGVPTLDVVPTATNVFGTTLTATGGVPAQATELALALLWGEGSTGAVTGTNTYSPNNGTNTTAWTTTLSTGTDNAIRGWAAPVAAPATASKFIMTWTTGGHTTALQGATFYDKVAVFSAPTTQMAGQNFPDSLVGGVGSTTINTSVVSNSQWRG